MRANEKGQWPCIFNTYVFDRDRVSYTREITV